MDLKGVKVTVVGISRSGLASALLLKKLGAAVYATDSSATGDIEKNCRILKAEGILYEIGAHTEPFVKGKDLLVVSPGVASDAPVIKWAQESRMPIMSEIELAYLFCKGRILAITGTNGKTTTTTLTGRIIEESGRPTIVCGNIGTPFAGKVPEITGEHYVVLEVSSFQLEWINKFKPYISAILNITDDHMDRHKVFDDYKKAKCRVFMNQEKEDFLVLNQEDLSLRDIGVPVAPRKIFFSRTEEVQGIFTRGKEIIWNVDGKAEAVCSTDIIRLKGLHNLENVMASIAMCKLIGISSADISKSISGFMPMPHRFQFFSEIEGVQFVNDSKATNVDGAIKALMSLDQPVVLIAGGRDKASDFSVIRDLVKQRVRSLILIGEAADTIAGSMNNTVPIKKAGTLREAVRLAYDQAERGDVVLLSPMCASFDMFKDYVQRGELFMQAVGELKKGLCVESESQS